MNLVEGIFNLKSMETALVIEGVYRHMWAYLPAGEGCHRRTRTADYAGKTWWEFGISSVYLYTRGKRRRLRLPPCNCLLLFSWVFTVIS